MSILKIPRKVKLIIIIFSNDINQLEEVKKILSKKFGKFDFESNQIPFLETKYYEKEMGDNLILQILSFKKLVKRDKLPKIKHITNKIEKNYSIKNNRRQVNIDPGLLSMENFILATGKAYSHRIYLSKGVWADLTLIYTKNGYKDLEWTYPNYKKDKIKKNIMEIRQIYSNQISQLK